jgi:hypothetical protein
MKDSWQREVRWVRWPLVAAALALLSVEASAGKTSDLQNQKEGTVIVIPGHFYCHAGALTAGERERHRELTEKLLGARSETMETAKGYEFQYRPEKISVAEVAEWVVLESKCCPFFDFHIDLEEQGQLVCLRLTGKEGVKAFIRAEFRLG